MVFCYLVYYSLWGTYIIHSLYRNYTLLQYSTLPMFVSTCIIQGYCPAWVFYKVLLLAKIRLSFFRLIGNLCFYECLPLTVVHYGIPYSAIMWRGKILPNLANWQPFAIVLLTILERVLVLSDCCYTCPLKYR